MGEGHSLTHSLTHFFQFYHTLPSILSFLFSFSYSNCEIWAFQTNLLTSKHFWEQAAMLTQQLNGFLVTFKRREEQGIMAGMHCMTWHDRGKAKQDTKSFLLVRHGWRSVIILFYSFPQISILASFWTAWMDQLWCDSISCDVAWRELMWCGVVRCGVVWHNVN